MGTITEKIQPVAGGPWAAPEIQQKDVQAVAPVTGTGGGTVGKTGDFATNDSAGSSLSNSGFSPAVLQQVQSFLKENMGLELKFIKDGNGKTVVQIIDSNTGEVIREIPPEKAALLIPKADDPRGILFDGKA